MYVGEKKIKGTNDMPNGEVQVTFKDGGDTVMNKELFKVIQSEEKRDGMVTDVVRQTLSAKYLEDMSNYGLDFGMVEHISMGMQTLIHNLREDLVSKTFNCQGLGGITLKDLLHDSQEEVE